LRLGRIEILLVILIVCGAAYMALQYFPGGKTPQLCSPVPLSPEVKAYIDQKLAAAPANAQCGDIPTVISRVKDLEGKLVSLEKFRELRENLEAKRENLESVSQEARRQQTDILTQLRNAELGRLRNEMAMMCSGISIRSSSPAPAAANRVGKAQGGQKRGKGAAAAASPAPGGEAAEESDEDEE